MCCRGAKCLQPSECLAQEDVVHAPAVLYTLKTVVVILVNASKYHEGGNHSSADVVVQYHVESTKSTFVLKAHLHLMGQVGTQRASLCL